jgi:hypothetical protein
MLNQTKLEPLQPKVTLISWTQDPLETIANVWWNAKTDKPVLSVKEISTRIKKDKNYKQEVEDLFKEVIDMLLPCSRFINFVFSVENVAISFREQLVRHKIGMEFWIQGGRVTDMSNFFDKGKYRIPEDIAKDEKLKVKYLKHMEQTQKFYKEMRDEGLKFEDAREIMPSGALHRLSFVCNVESLHNLVSKRTGWLLQGDLWIPIIQGIVDELESKVSSVFRTFAYPPEVNRKREYVGYKFKELSYDRYAGITRLPVCPIFFYKEKEYIENRSRKPIKSIQQLRKEGLWDDQRVEVYKNLWGFNPAEL